MTVTRDAITNAAYSVWPMGLVPYSQNLRWNGVWRQDCSGFASACTGAPVDGPGSWGGWNTATAVSDGYVTELPQRPGYAPDLLPGDLVGIMGPGTEGNDGHVAVFIRWVNDDPQNVDMVIVEQRGGIDGPNERVFTFPLDSDWHGYRVNDLAVDVPTPPAAPEPQYVQVTAYEDGNPAWTSTLSGIAEHEGTTVEALLALNPDITDADVIYPNQLVRVS